MRSHRDANRVACPYCGVQPDQPCINPPTGTPFAIWTVHRERVTAWEAGRASRDL